jgi:hypothetical protein
MGVPVLGEIILGADDRDAVHVAIAPVIAVETLMPGQHIGLSNGSILFAGGYPAKFIGIVDPFLKEPVHRHQKFWMLLYPDTVEGLRHQWTHHAFQAYEDAKRWLERFAVEECRLSYMDLYNACNDWVMNGEYHTFYGFDTPDRCWTDIEELWKNYQIVSGVEVPESQQQSFFSCSC